VHLAGANESTHFWLTHEEWNLSPFKAELAALTRFEQLDVTEGGADYDLVKSIEDELEVLPMDAPGSAVYAQTKLASAFTQQTLDLFQGNGKGLKTWAK
jgi:hypothetical protein